MDVTPSKKMLEAMLKFTDGLVGEAPHPTDHGPGAQKRRQQRGIVMNWLHDFSRLNMREGVGRYLRELGQKTVQDEVRPSKGRSLHSASNDSSIIANPHDH